MMSDGVPISQNLVSTASTGIMRHVVTFDVERRFADTDEKRTLIDTDASHRRFALMIFQIFHSCESVFPPSCLRAVVSSWFFTSLRYHWLLYSRNSQ